MFDWLEKIIAAFKSALNAVREYVLLWIPVISWMDSRPFRYLVLGPFIFVLAICSIYYVPDMRNANTGPLFALIALYIVHVGLLYSKANGPADEYISKCRDIGNVARIRRERVSGRSLLDCVGYHDGGWNSIWAYTAISFLLPVFLSAVSDILPLPSDTGGESVVDGLVREICVASMIVLIALELSHIHILRKNAADWFPTMLASLALDISILVIVGVVDKYTPLTDLSTILIVAVNVVAVIATLNALLFARVAGALYDDKIDMPDLVESTLGDRS